MFNARGLPRSNKAVVRWWLVVLLATRLDATSKKENKEK
jgi:hypothetical protein